MFNTLQCGRSQCSYRQFRLLRQYYASDLPGTCDRQRFPAARLPGYGDRRRVLLGWRPRLQYAAAVGARQPAGERYARFSDRSLECAGRVSAQSARIRDASEGNPLFEPHTDGDGSVQEEADPAARCGETSCQNSQGIAPNGRGGDTRVGGGRESLQSDPVDLPCQELRGDVQGLRVLAPDDGRALAVGLPRCRAHPAPPGGVAAPARNGWRVHLRSRTRRSRIGFRNSIAIEETPQMKLAEVRRNAFAMPLNDPAYPPGPYKFYNREFVVITYRTDIDRLREVVPEPLEVAADTVAYEFIRMPDSTGFGDYTETGQVIPVRFATRDGTVQEGGYVHAMYLDDNAPIAGGREIWGFPKKLASPKMSHEGDVVVCTLHYGSVLCVSATMGFKHRELDPAPLLKALARPNFMIKIIPHVDCTPRVCELVRYYMEDVTVKGAWAGPAAIQLFQHALCDVARLPVREVVSATHYVTDLTLGLGEVVFDYLQDA